MTLFQCLLIAIPAFVGVAAVSGLFSLITKHGMTGGRSLGKTGRVSASRGRPFFFWALVVAHVATLSAATFAVYYLIGNLASD